jgi:hypothetical protein
MFETWLEKRELLSINHLTWEDYEERSKISVSFEGNLKRITKRDNLSMRNTIGKATGMNKKPIFPF